MNQNRTLSPDEMLETKWIKMHKRHTVQRSVGQVLGTPFSNYTQLGRDTFCI